MRALTRTYGVLVFLLATPAWASDMCPLGMFVFLPPIYLLALVAFLAGAIVRGYGAALAWLFVLLLCALPALGALALCAGGAYHGEALRHEEMLTWSAVTFGVFVASYAWGLRRLWLVKAPAPVP
ncbi:hypothetical protein LY474_33710 [Myxococcus stipitatus]|uniref:hypothetical protein n=1 Tax=Myxococcus stipitatus TaxID=83455 RepID=UPI001F486698|nr:hypothetical protein [Myxococcus stipitatus]MCE9672774.1 hypothetical protein [Myxococcus stipitatus]